MSPLALHIKNVSVNYQHRVIFSNINLLIPAGKWIALIGKSGIGKSSLLRAITGLIHPKANLTGNIYFNNHSPLPNQLAYMPQNDLLIPWLNALQNATLQLRLSPSNKKQQLTKATALLQQVGLGKFMNTYPHQLSGGMRQRVALVRTLLQEKPVVLMDEAFSSLDTITRYQLHELALHYLKDKSVLFVTHDPYEALRLADEIYIMHGKPAVLQHIASLTTRAPRKLADPDILELQDKIFTALSHGFD